MRNGLSHLIPQIYLSYLNLILGVLGVTLRWCMMALKDTILNVLTRIVDTLHGDSLRVLVGCEFSGIVREAFRLRGHDAWSCDLLPTEIEGQHIQGDVLNILNDRWDLAIFHPPCTHLAVSGARYFKYKQREQADALEFVRQLLDAPIPKIALENPVSVISTRIRKPDQIIQPWMFGHEETKTTCLWLKNLPELVPTKVMEIRNRNLTPSGQNKLPPSPTRWMDRSRTYPGIAQAFAEQWG